MTTAAQLSELFQQALQPQFLDVRDDSARHAGHAGGQPGRGHFIVTIVSTRFEQLSLLQRHRLVYDLVGDRMKTSIHALALTLHTPAEHNSIPSPG